MNNKDRKWVTSEVHSWTEIECEARRRAVARLDEAIAKVIEQSNAVAARLAAAEKSGDATIADLSARLETLTRTVGELIGRVVNLERPKAEAEKPTPPKPKCPWCGSTSSWVLDDGLAHMLGEHRCCNPYCGRTFWV